MQRYLNAAFAALMIAVFAFGIYAVKHDDPRTAKNGSGGVNSLDSAAAAGGPVLGMGIALLLATICLVVFPRFRMLVIGPPSAPVDGPGELFRRLIRVLNGLVIFLTFVLIVGGKLGSMLP